MVVGCMLVSNQHIYMLVSLFSSPDVHHALVLSSKRPLVSFCRDTCKPDSCHFGVEAMISRVNVWILAVNAKETEFPVESYFKHIPSVYWAQMCCITHFPTSRLHKQSVWQVTEMWNMYFGDSLHNSQISVLLNTIFFSEGLIVRAIWNSNVLPVTVMYLFSSEVLIKGFEQLPSSR